MAISYPLTHPATPGFAQIDITAFDVVAIAQSAFTLQEQVYAHQGGIWRAAVSLPPMKRETAAAWCAWLTALRGRYGTFLLGDSSAKTARGVATGTPLVNGSSQTGLTLVTDGWTAGVTGILKAGDYISIGSGTSTRLYMVVSDANSNGSGQATLEIWPRLRESPADNAAITVSNAKGLFRLDTNERGWTVDRAKIFGISFSAVEAIQP